MQRLQYPVGILVGAVIMTLGTTWDIQWHALVGRDDFWIPPHIVLYAGVVTAGVAVLLSLLSETHGPSAPPSLSAASRGGHAGAKVSAGGLLVIFISALFDNWWHQSFGIDATVWSPPHLLLILGGVAIGVGGILELASGLRLELFDPDVRPLASMAVLFGLGWLMGPATLVLLRAVRLSFLAPTAQSAFLYPVLAALVLPVVLGAGLRSTGLRWGASAITVTALAITVGSGIYAAIGFNTFFPGGLPTPDSPLAEELGIPAQGNGWRWLVLSSMLPALPALALDFVVGGRTQTLKLQVVGATIWAAVLLGESLLVWRWLQGDFFFLRALQLLPVMAGIASVALVAGYRIGPRTDSTGNEAKQSSRREAEL